MSTGTQGAERAPMPQDLTSRNLVKRIVQLAIFGVIVAALISTLPGLGDVRERFAHGNPLWIVVCGVLELASCLSYVVAFRGVFCRRLSWRFSYEIGMAEQATNVLVPAGGVGGLALGAWALREGGMSTGHIARRSVAFFILTSAPNFLCAALFGWVLVTGVLPGSGPHALTLALAIAATTTILLVVSLPLILGWLSKDQAPQGSGRITRLRIAARRAGEAVDAGVRDAATLLRTREPFALVGAVGYMAFDLAALGAAFAAFGGSPPFAAFAFAYVVGQLGGLIPLPGGIGGTDGGLIAVLSVYGSPLAQATAAVLAYRAFQLGIPAILGALAFVSLRRTLATSDAPAALCEPLADPLPVMHVPAR